MNLENYYLSNRVCYLCIEKNKGRAIVNGNKNYIVDFCYENGEISNLVCFYFCSSACKHEFATMLRLKECLEIINKNYAAEYSDYFSAISKDVFWNKVFKNMSTGKIDIVF